MKMLTNRRTLQLVVLAALALGAVLLWSAQASAQPAKPPFLLYGTGEAGDTISVYDEMGEELAATAVDADGNWHMSVNCASEKLPTLSFQLNGAPATPTINQTGADQAEITLTVSGDAMPDEAMPDDSDTGMVDEGDEMMEDDMTEDGDEMMEDDDSSMMQEDDDEMMDDEMSDDEMMDNGYPESGTGGLADQSGPSTAALIGTVAILLTLLSALTIHRLRSNRA